MWCGLGGYILIFENGSTSTHGWMDGSSSVGNDWIVAVGGKNNVDLSIEFQ